MNKEKEVSMIELPTPDNNNLNIPTEFAFGRYSNRVNVGMDITHGEDFELLFQHNSHYSGCTVVGRIILNPQHYKRLVRTMEMMLDRYESTFGPVEENREVQSKKESQE